MTGQGPRIDPAAQAERDAGVDAAATVGTWAAQQAYQLGRESADWEIAGALLDQNEAHRAPMAADQEMAAYGELGREHFGDPRPGDFPGRQHEPEREAEAG
jgi:hypothetical protein